MRTQLRRYVWGSDGLPLREQPARIARGVSDPSFDGLDNLRRIDRLTIKIDLGFESTAYHLIPRRSNGRLLLYHNGHGQNLDAGKRTAAYFLLRGYSVLVLAMPIAGMNRHPPVVMTPCGPIELPGLDNPYGLHEGFSCLPHPLRFFLEPVVVSLNYARRSHYRSTAMVGLSGGGWTTVVSAALDPRIRQSYPVAGSFPKLVHADLCSRSPDPMCHGDFEQRDPALDRIANYLQLYALGSWGTGRRQLAIYNIYDPCCFSGTSYEVWKHHVQRAVRRLRSGSYNALGDATHREHKISERALAVIAGDLERGP
ncbi:MAG: hypothetical protein H0U03_09025 [Actinobacteria bacterium]|nr:hypothetical protein [Actinomycetota bacterium]